MQTPADQTPAAQGTPALDVNVAMARVGGDRGLLLELADLFLQEYPRMLADLESATASGDAKRVENTAHGLKGSAANFGAGPTVEAALLLEQLGREKKCTQFSEALASLQQRLALLDNELNAL